MVTATAVAGTPLQLTGTTSGPDAAVGVTAMRDKNDMREASVAKLDGTWRAVLLFGDADAGTWVIDINVDDVECSSELTVTLPPGVVAPPTRAPVVEAPGDASDPGMDASTIRSSFAIAAAAIVVGSWIFLAVVALISVISRDRPLANRRVLRVARLATFAGVLGAFMAVGLFVAIAISMSHFDSGVPPQEAALLETGLWVLAIVGSIVGTLMARRLSNGGPLDGR